MTIKFAKFANFIVRNFVVILEALSYGVFGVSTWPIGCDTPGAPLPILNDFLSVSPLESMRSGGAIPPPPPKKGYLSDTCVIPHANKASGLDTALCDTFSKRYCAIWGGISHWAAKTMPNAMPEMDY